MIIRLILLAVGCTNAFHLPGGAPVDYTLRDPVPLLVNAISAELGDGQTGLSSFLSFDYYDERMPFCRPPEGVQKQGELLGSILFGDRIYNSPFELKMLEDTSCRTLCINEINATRADPDISFLVEKIAQGYAAHFLVDGLPAAELKVDDKTGDQFYGMGFPIGSAAAHVDGIETAHLNNHYDIMLEYHSRPDGNNRVVGVVVLPSSLDSLRPGSAVVDCTVASPFIVRSGQSKQVAFTYSVSWKPSQKQYASRWDAYLRVLNPKIHFLALSNSIIIALLLSCFVGAILSRAISRDINKYSAIDLGEDVQEDSAWRKIYGEIFRPPVKRNILSALVGSGAQISAMIMATLFFSCLGFLSPVNRGALSSAVIIFWTMGGTIAGYVSSRLYASLHGDDWRKNVAWTALLVPFILFISIFYLNFVLIVVGASGAIPAGTIIFVVIAFCVVNIPLTLLGSWAGAKKGAISHPTRVNAIPRQIPPNQSWFMRPIPGAIIVGLLPFGAAFIECFYILQSLVSSRAYYAVGFLALTGAVVVVTTATVTILMCYFLLCAEDYRWHWRSFLTGGGSSFWIFAYGVVYWVTRLNLGFADGILYLGYITLISAVSFVVTGTIGFVSTYAFLRIIYSRIRVD